MRREETGAMSGENGTLQPLSFRGRIPRRAEGRPPYPTPNFTAQADFYANSSHLPIGVMPENCQAFQVIPVCSQTRQSTSRGGQTEGDTEPEAGSRPLSCQHRTQREEKRERFKRTYKLRDLQSSLINCNLWTLMDPYLNKLSKSCEIRKRNY
ncbi:uncharacterized protein LOC128311800 isoform X1 [Acinonyx jubatus]|uniref:Uncharacterized protein LOC128311800 isoform X1 n=1 Tax=Acinonyx jubatus TaxID=32536 RepID=A0ABM3NIQ4_ACIJB|nr:uncharacterized protein LOC128311800 isoform X1 [Acinonyx jubatus]